MLHRDKENFLKDLTFSERLGDILKELNESRSTVYFKLNLLKLLEKYPKLKKSLLTLNFFRSYFKIIKETCKEN